MRTVNMSRINENIKERRQAINLRIKSEQNNQPRVRRLRYRSEDERKALTEVTRVSVERAKKEGKMKMIGKRTMYYDPTE